MGAAPHPPGPAPVAEPPPPAPAGGGGPFTRPVAGLLLAAALGAVGVWALRRGGEPTPETTAAAPPATPVEVVVVRTEDVPLSPRWLAQAGASHVVEVRSRVAGYLVERSFTEGAVVTSGQLLFRIDPRPTELELAEGRARLAAAEARRDRARQQLARLAQLRSRQAATAGDVEEQEKEERVAVAEVELHAAQIASAELRLDYASIEAPISGVIGEAALDVGGYVGSPTDRLAVIRRVDPLYVRLSLSERDLLLLERGRPRAPDRNEEPGAERYRGLEFRVTLADGREHPQRGRFDFVEPELSASTATIMVRGAIPNPGGDLRPGQFVHVTVVGLERKGIVRVPQAALLHAPTGSSVYVVGPAGTVEARSIEAGEWLGEGLWEVTRGLAPGDRVVTNRLLVLRPGAPVAPTEVTLEAAATTGAAPHGQAPAPAKGKP